MSSFGKDERIDVNGIKISLKLLEGDQKIEEQPRTRYLSACFALVAFGAMLWTVLGAESVDKIVKVYKFQEASCQVVQSNVVVKNLSCYCEGRTVCQSIYPCVKISVVLKNLKPNLTGSRTVVYNTIYDVNSECSFGPPCKRSYEQNLQAVESFTSKFRNHSNTITCYYNPADQQQIILRRDGHVNDIFHALFWPFLFVVAGILMLYKFFRS